MQKPNYSPGVRLLNVEEPPSELELPGKVEDPDEFAVYGRYSKHITSEIAIDRDVFGESLAQCSKPAYAIGSALRVRSRIEMLFPLVCDHSWSTISGASKKCKVSLYEDIPMAIPNGPTVIIADGDLEPLTKPM